MLQKIWQNKKILVLIVAMLGLAGWYFLGRQSAPTYTEYRIETKDLAETIELSGKVSAQSYATLRFPTGGLVTYLGPKEGDTVKKWQTLASLDTRQTQKILEQKLNLYAIQRGSFDQTKDDYRKNIDDGDVDQELRRLLEKNQYQLDNVVKDVEYQDLSLRLSRLTSPLAGILVAAPLNVANVNVTAADTWTVVDPQSLEFIADLDESDLKRVSVGQKVSLKIDAYPDLVLASTIGSISFAPKETTSGTTYEVKIAIPSTDVAKLRLGLNGSAEIILNEKAGVPAIPAQAVTYKGGKVEVLVKNGTKYEPKFIELGIETDNSLEVIGGLSVGDLVYVKK